MYLTGISDIAVGFRNVEDDSGSEFEGGGEMVGFRMGDLGFAQMRKLKLEVFDRVAVVAGLWRVEEEVIHDHRPCLSRISRPPSPDIDARVTIGKKRRDLTRRLAIEGINAQLLLMRQDRNRLAESCSDDELADIQSSPGVGGASRFPVEVESGGTAAAGMDALVGFVPRAASVQRTLLLQ